MINIDIGDVNCCNTCCINIKGNSGTIQISNHTNDDIYEEMEEESFRLPKKKKLFFDPNDHFIKLKENIDPARIRAKDHQKGISNYLSIKARLVFYRYIQNNYPPSITTLVFNETNTNIDEKLDRHNGTDLLTVGEVAKVQASLKRNRRHEQALEQLINSNARLSPRKSPHIGFIGGDVERSLEDIYVSSNSSDSYEDVSIDSTERVKAIRAVRNIGDSTLCVPNRGILQSVENFKQLVGSPHQNSLSQRDIKNLHKVLECITPREDTLSS